MIRFEKKMEDREAKKNILKYFLSFHDIKKRLKDSKLIGQEQEWFGQKNL